MCVQDVTDCDHAAFCKLARHKLAFVVFVPIGNGVNAPTAEHRTIPALVVFNNQCVQQFMFWIVDFD